MADLALTTLRGGMNNTDPSVSLTDDQCVLAENVEFYNSMLGDRRNGTTAISLPASITATDRVTFLHRHLPSDDTTGSELWVLGVTGTASAVLSKKTTSWTDITVSDTPTLTGVSQYQWQAVSLHGKLHIAYDSSVDRLHVWDGTSLRRSGLVAPAAAPTGANGGGAGTLTTTRYYRVRFTEQVSGTTVRRSEPSAVLTFTPDGSHAGVVVTKPATVSEGETHWELEASLDNINFYVLATTAVGTTTVTDTTDNLIGYASTYTLSEDIEDYALIPSAKYLVADADRLVWAGSWENAAYASRVGWTPVFTATGVGNDERFKTSVDPFKDLDTYENGAITGLSTPVLGYIWVFKQHAIYKLVRTGRESNAYDAIKYTTAVGAIPGSVVSGVDASGQPCVYFLDYQQGPCRLGLDGLFRCGDDIRKTWETINVDATAVVCSALYYPLKKQVYWNVATSANNTPDTRLVLHTGLSRVTSEGVRRGWALWTGTIAKALTMCLYADNIDDNAARSQQLVPFIGLEGLGLVHRCETGVDDNGTAYTATVTTKPYWMRSLMGRFSVMAAIVVAKATAGAAIVLNLIRDFGLETTSDIVSVSLAPTGSESDVVQRVDNFVGAELRTAQFQITDIASPTARWEVNRLELREELGQRD